MKQFTEHVITQQRRLDQVLLNQSLLLKAQFLRLANRIYQQLINICYATAAESALYYLPGTHHCLMGLLLWVILLQHVFMMLEFYLSPYFLSLQNEVIFTFMARTLDLILNCL